MNEPILDVRDLSIDFASEEGAVRAVDRESFAMQQGEILGLVGESGAGKTLTSEAILRLIRCPPGRLSGEILYRGRNLLQLSEAELADIRGREIAMIFQNPISSLNPVFRIGAQLLETMALHLEPHWRILRRQVIDILTRVGIPSAQRRAQDYPHQFSGGMCQRTMIGMGIACTPRILIADEPTTALDVTIQAQILALIRRLAAELGMAVLLVSHDLGVVRFMSHRVAVMYLGKLVEIGPAASLFVKPLHPYSEALLASIPTIGDGSHSMFDQTERLLSGELPDPIDLPPGCRFYNRCPYRMERCRTTEPELTTMDGEHAVACHVYEP